MAHLDLEEQEQLDSIKTWWKMYGNRVTSVVTAAAIAVIGRYGWQWYQQNQAGQASVVFSALESAIADKDSQRIKATAGELTEKYTSTPYAALGALAAAKASFEAGDMKTARLQLAWVAEHGKNEVRDIARLRLAAVLLDDQAYAEALKSLEEPYPPAFAARFNELRGEVLLAQGKKEEARKAFEAALARFDERQSVEKAKTAKPEENGQSPESSARQPYRELLQHKIDALGGKA